MFMSFDLFSVGGQQVSFKYRVIVFVSPSQVNV